MDMYGRLVNGYQVTYGGLEEIHLTAVPRVTNVMPNIHTHRSPTNKTYFVLRNDKAYSFVKNINQICFILITVGNTKIENGYCLIN